MKVYRDDQRLLNFRINVLMWLIIAGIVVLAGSFWYVQGVHAERFRGLSESNRLRETIIPAQRGLILDRNGKIFVDNQPSYTLMLVRSDLAEIERSNPGHRDRMIAFLTAVLNAPVEEIERRIARHAGVPSNRAVPVVEDLNMQQVSEVEAHRISFPALSVSTLQRRHYRYATMAAHVLGYIGESTPDDLDRDPDLKMGDLVGKKGIELVYEEYLHGTDGSRLMIVDSHGRFLSELEGTRHDAISGKDVYLTIDFDLQRRAEQYFLENEMVGTAVALDPRNGEILALVSSPAFDPNVYSKRLTPETWQLILSNPFKVELNRSIQGLYSPGSVFKPVMAMAALEKGVITPETSFYCRGKQVFFGREFRCWKRGGHGEVNLEEALKISCDTYFYNLGALLGIDTIASYARLLTFGEQSRIDLTGEKAGLLPTTTWARDVQKRTWYPSETISVSIGQGPLLVSPLQVANMMAAIANGGLVYRPHLVRQIESRDATGQGARRTITDEIIHQVDIDQKALDVVRNGLWRAVNEIHGTGWSARLVGVDIAGKTGTAQVITQQTWTKSEDLPYRFRDHAWFASFAPKDDPELVVVVLVEHGGHGGSQAAPLATEIYRAWFANRLAGTGAVASGESPSAPERDAG